MADVPSPTRTTARFAEEKGEGAREGVGELEGVAEHDPSNTGATEYGAEVTPRNTVFTGAVARTVLTSEPVLYAYSLVGEVRYSINTPHTSDRPAMEMIMVPLSINMADVGVCRDHVVPDPVYCAMLLTVSDAVSVIQIAVESGVNTKPNGFVVVLSMRVPEGFNPVGRPVNRTMPAPRFPELAPSVQYSVVDVATKVPSHNTFD